MKEAITICFIIMEIIIFAIVGLIAAIFGQVWWSIFMACMIFCLAIGTTIKIGGKK